MADRFDGGQALRMLSLREQVHPRDVIAWVYEDQAAADAAADAWAASNADHYGHPSLGTVPAEGGGIIGALDLRPALAGHGVSPTDPARPDAWHPPPPGPVR